MYMYQAWRTGQGVSFYSLPPVVHNQGDKTQEILLKRRHAWIARSIVFVVFVFPNISYSNVLAHVYAIHVWPCNAYRKGSQPPCMRSRVQAEKTCSKGLSVSGFERHNFLVVECIYDKSTLTNLKRQFQWTILSISNYTCRLDLKRFWVKLPYGCSHKDVLKVASKEERDGNQARLAYAKRTASTISMGLRVILGICTKQLWQRTRGVAPREQS